MCASGKISFVITRSTDRHYSSAGVNIPTAPGRSMKLNKEKLIELAEQITPPTQDCSDRIIEQIDVLTNALNRRMIAREDLISLIGSGNEDLMEINHSKHFRYVASLASLYDAKNMVETILWVIRTYCAHGFSPRYWDFMLPETRQILLHHLPAEEFLQVQVIYDFISQHFTDFVNIAYSSASFFEEISTIKDPLDS